jgi:8-amino-7-oxononanoate synthase
MSDLNAELQARLLALREQELYRELHPVDSPQTPHLVVGGRPLLNFSSNDYLGLANHPALKEAAQQATRDFGAGAGASRLLCGSLAPHHRLEQALAEFKGVEAALSFSSGYAAALGTIPALVGSSDVVIIDKWVHACLVDAARLSGAQLRVFTHNDLNDLERILQWADARSRMPDAGSRQRPAQILVITESVFSMDGDLAPLREMVALKDRYGAWLMVDEAHATGLFGPGGRGLAETCDVAGRIEVQMGTLGKALGAAGGYIGGSRPLIDYLVNRARSFIFSTAPVPAAAAAATAAIGLVQSDEGQHRRQQLWKLVGQARTALPPLGWPVPEAPSAILPLLVGPEPQALHLADQLRDRGFWIPAVRYPTVARGQARLRLTLSAAHTDDDVARLLDALAGLKPPA